VVWTAVEANVYWGLFSLALLAIALWEFFGAWRPVSKQLVRRWTNHAVLLIVSTLLAGLLFRTTAVYVAIAVSGSRFGLLNHSSAPLLVRTIAGILILDLFQYGMHRLYHAVPALWRIHRVHHSDPELDLSTGLRHHPLEALLQQASLLAFVALLAPPAVSVFAIELLGLFQDFFTHANANLPTWVEKPLRAVLITPEMHRIHHADEMRDQNANLGEVFPWWDRLFGTYMEAPSAGADGIQIGLKGCQGPEAARLPFMLAEPFRSDPAGVPQPRAAAAPAILKP